MTGFWHDPRVVGALHGAATGFVGAFAVDVGVWRSYHSWKDFHTFDFSTASFRWMQGTVGGAISGAGLTALLG